MVGLGSCEGVGFQGRTDLGVDLQLLGGWFVVPGIQASDREGKGGNPQGKGQVYGMSVSHGVEDACPAAGRTTVSGLGMT